MVDTKYKNMSKQLDIFNEMNNGVEAPPSVDFVNEVEKESDFRAYWGN